MTLFLARLADALTARLRTPLDGLYAGLDERLAQQPDRGGLEPAGDREAASPTAVAGWGRAA